MGPEKQQGIYSGRHCSRRDQFCGQYPCTSRRVPSLAWELLNLITYT